MATRDTTRWHIQIYVLHSSDLLFLLLKKKFKITILDNRSKFELVNFGRGCWEVILFFKNDCSFLDSSMHLKVKRDIRTNE